MTSTTASTQSVNIICMKWGTKYGSEFVNKLYGMVARNITLPFQFYCFTDDSNGIREEVQSLPLPSLQLPEGIPERGWLKLSTFNAELAGITGTTLFLDVDVVIVGNIDGFFQHQSDDPNTVFLAFDEKKKAARIGNSSVYRFEVGAHTDIVEFFRENFDSIRQRHRNEQAYLSKQLDAKQQLDFWPTAWCPSFKYHCIPKFPFNFFKPAVIPEGAKIILFHGHPEPQDAVKGISRKWYRHFKPCLWINQYWQA